MSLKTDYADLRIAAWEAVESCRDAGVWHEALDGLENILDKQEDARMALAIAQLREAENILTLPPREIPGESVIE